jgi:hypothetical protein
MDDIQEPIYSSERLIGLELEYDSGSMTFRAPDSIPGWAIKYDGSLSNGREFVLEPAVSVSNLKATVKTFCEAFDPIRIGLTQRGGYHVHVQAHDYTITSAVNLARLYTHHQASINSLLAKSRVNNRYCVPFSPTEAADISANFQLDSPANSRSEAKGARITKVINFAMLRCTDPAARSVEFRQGSPSKRFVNIYGWAMFCAALTEFCRNTREVNNWLLKPNAFQNFLELITCIEERVGIEHLRSWIEWRHAAMNPTVTPELVQKVVAAVGSRPMGLFTLATKTNENYPTVKAVVNEAIKQGLLTIRGNKYCQPPPSLDGLQDSLETEAETALTALQEAASARVLSTP